MNNTQLVTETKDAPIESASQLAKLLLAKNDFGNHYARKSVMNVFSDCRENEDDGNPQPETRCLRALVELDAADLLSAAKDAIHNGYNSFNQKRLEAILFALVSRRGRGIEPRDLKDINRDYKFRFGREGSPVLYIKGRYRFWMEDLQRIAKASRADEISIEADGWLRIWWD